MRKERENNPLHTAEQKNLLRWTQIDNCQKKAQKLNFDTLSDDTIRAYQKLLAEKSLGTDISSLEFKKGRSELFIDSIPVLVRGLTAGYLQRVFDKLRFQSSVDEPKASFSLLDVSGSSDGQSVDRNREFVELFQEYKEAWKQVEDWTPIDGAVIFLEALQRPVQPLLPNLRRDLAARTGCLTDLPNVVGGARITLPTTILGVLLKSDFGSGTEEFPHVEVVTVKLR